MTTKRLAGIGGLVIALLLTHALVWGLGVRSGYVMQGKTDARMDIPLTVRSWQALETNDTDRVRRALLTQMCFDIQTLEGIETNRSEWFYDALDCYLEVMQVPDSAFKAVTLAEAKAIHEEHHNAQPPSGD